MENSSRRLTELGNYKEGRKSDKADVGGGSESEETVSKRSFLLCVLDFGNEW